MALFIATFAMVFLRAIQQQNVIHGNWLAAGITPFAIAGAEVASVLLVVQSGWQSVPVVGAGGAAGVLAAMVFYRKYLKRNKT